MGTLIVQKNVTHRSGDGTMAKGSECPVRGQAVWGGGLPSREGRWLETFPASWAVWSHVWVLGLDTGGGGADCPGSWQGQT